MLAVKHLNKNIQPLQSKDTVRTALDKMAEYKAWYMPLLIGGKYMGLVTEEELQAGRDLDVQLGLKKLNLLYVYALDTSHTLEVLNLFGDLKRLTMIPVLNQHKKFLGCIESADLLQYTAQLFAVHEPGAIIVLSVSNRDNSLSHLAQIVEIENAQILSSSVNTIPDSSRLEISLKVNKTDVSSIIASFERYNYEVIAVFNNSGSDNGYMDRYDSLMNYLNV